jgi:cytochrome c oxidase cbb3-type subunit 3
MENKNKKVKYDGKPFEHEFDGIKELNNAIPPWLLYMWYISVFFAVVYIVYYHVYEIGDLQEAEYVNQMAKAKAEAKLEKPGQFAVVLLTDDGSLAAGKAIFNEKLCITCHAALGEGNAIGPNLTDNYWLHGKGKVEDVFNTIKNGVPTKGMTPYKDQLSEKQILQVSSFILEKLVGSNPPNAKEPQGTLAK